MHTFLPPPTPQLLNEVTDTTAGGNERYYWLQIQIFYSLSFRECNLHVFVFSNLWRVCTEYHLLAISLSRPYTVTSR